MRIGYDLDKEMKPSKLKLLYMEGPGGEKDKAASKKQMMLTQRAVETSSMLLQRLSAQAGQDIGTFVIRETAILRGLRRELVFCLSAVRLARSWETAGLSWCFPEIRPAEEKVFSAKGLFDPLLLLSDKEQVVTNDADLLTGGELVFLTGANQGGKTVYLLSIGLCQCLAQLGFPVPAESAALSPVKNILTIFAPNGQQYGRNGLLAEEAGRIAEAVTNLTGDSMLLFNEPLTSTGPEETKSISAEVAAVCLAAGARGVWVTHVYELARERGALEAAIPWGSRTGSLRVVLEEENGSPRFTYRVERGEPLGDSHAEDALRRGGVLFT
jgi:DNA mismatch repair ATPase MutS